MNVRSQKTQVECDASGSASVTTSTMTGKLTSIAYVPDPDLPFGPNMELIIRGADGGFAVWQETGLVDPKLLLPRFPTHDSQGTEISYQGMFKVYDHLYFEKKAADITVTNAVPFSKGTFEITIEGTR